VAKVKPSINHETKPSLEERKEAAKERTAKQRTERESRDPVTEILNAQQDSAPFMAMRARVEDALKRNLDWDSTRSPWNGYDKELVAREAETGETIEKFMEWHNSDEFRRDKQVIYLTPTKINDWWKQAFKHKQPELDLYPTI
jgi:hypothetical protein